MSTGSILVTAAKLQDSAGNLISGAKAFFTPVLWPSGAQASFRAPGPGYGQVMSTPIVVGVDGGALSVTLPDVAQCIPQNVGFALQIYDGLTDEPLLGPGYACLQPSSTTSSDAWAAGASIWCNSNGSANLDLYPPDLPAMPTVSLGGGSTTGVGPAGPPGTPGAPGTPATVTVVQTTTGAPGSPAAVTNSGTASAAVLSFTVPTGQPGTNGTNGTNGAPGQAATVTLGTTTTGAPGSQASVSNTGTTTAAVLTFTIPAGQPGTNGTNGTNGAPGNPGQNATLALGSVSWGVPGQPGSVTNVGTPTAAVLDIVMPFPATSVAPTVTLPAGSEATAALSLGPNGSLVFTFGLPAGSGSGSGSGTGSGGTSTATGVVLIDANGSNYLLFSNNGSGPVETLATSGNSSGITAVASLTLIAPNGSFWLVSSVNGRTVATSTTSGTGAVASVTLSDTVTDGTRQMSVNNAGELITV